jgi:hypothetical protein
MMLKKYNSYKAAGESSCNAHAEEAEPVGSNAAIIKLGEDEGKSAEEQIEHL